jgi:hypothetical protein
MESYPVGKISFANKVISASVANTSSFATLKVLTASISLNSPGPSGSSGSAFAVSGSVGPRGETGPSGSKGLGVYLLSSILGTCCNRFDPFLASWRGTTNTNADSFKYCNTDVYSQTINNAIYSTGSAGAVQIGYTMHLLSGCNSPIGAYTAIIDGSGNYYVMNSSGGVTDIQSCSS